MAERPSIKTQRLTRDELASFLRGHKLIKTFENLIDDVSETLPDAVAGSNSDADTVLAQVAFARPIPTQQQPADTSQSILAAQIFGG